jgi:hypothetical protein
VKINAFCKYKTTVSSNPHSLRLKEALSSNSEGLLFLRGLLDLGWWNAQSLAYFDVK